MAVYTVERDYHLDGRMSKTILDDHIRTVVSKHNTWNDANGASHLRAMMLHHSFSIPVVDGRVMLGPWQNVLLIECDTGPRTRTIWYQVQGER